MKAFSIVAPGKTVITEVPEPVPAAAEVLVRVAMVGLCGSDLNTFRGLNPMVSLPRVPGHEVSGWIAAVGSGVPKEFHPGTKITLSPYTNCGTCSACLRARPNCCRYNQTFGVQRDGALVDFLVVPWEKLFVANELSIRDLTLVEPLTVGMHAVSRANVVAGDTVAVLGCGTIGLGAVSGAAFAGGRVIAVDIDDDKLLLARQAGATETVNSAVTDLGDDLCRLTDGRGPDVVIEAIGLPSTFRAAVAHVCFAGRVVYIGYATEPVEYETKLFVQKELDIRGSRNALSGDFDRVIDMLRGDVFPVAQVVTRVVSFDQAGEALAEWAANPAAVTKILVDVSGSS